MFIKSAYVFYVFYL